jgi:hypothetical protein
MLSLIYSIIKRVLLFFVPFTVFFIYIHVQFGPLLYPSSQAGLIGLYSTAGFIFSLIVAFVIQRGWEMWANLSVSVSTEIDAVRELWKWSSLGDASLRDAVHTHLQDYLALILSECAMNRDTSRDERTEIVIDNLRSLIVHRTLSLQGLGSQIRIALDALIRARNLRLSFSNEHIPGLLKRILGVAAFVLVGLSLFIAINSVYLDYAITAMLGLLAYALMAVVDDLDNPFRPGAWQLTTKGYELLLSELLLVETNVPG